MVKAIFILSIILLLRRSKMITFKTVQNCQDSTTLIMTSNHSYIRDCLGKCLAENCCKAVLEDKDSCHIYGKIDNIARNHLISDTYQEFSATVNVAPFGIASQSSDYAVGNVAGKGIDGSVATFCCTLSESNPWWKIDLKKSYFIIELSVDLRIPSRFRSVTIYLSQFPVTPGQYQSVPVFATYPGIATANHLNFTAASGAYGTWGRYLVIQENVTNVYFEMQEVSIFARE